MQQNINCWNWLSIKKLESVSPKHCNNLKAFIEYSNDMDNICEKIEEYNPNKKRKNIKCIEDLLYTKKLQSIQTQVLIISRK